MKALLRFVREEEGQDLVEYAMLIALIAVAMVGGVTAFRNALNTFYTTTATAAPLGGS